MARTSGTATLGLLAALAAPTVAHAQAQRTSTDTGVPLDVQAAPMAAAYPRPGAYGVPQPAPYPYPFRTHTVPYEGGPIPPGARLTTHHSTGLIVTGGLVFLLSYAASIALWNVNAGSCPGGRTGCGNSAFMAVPVLGPFLALGDGATFNRFGAPLVLDGLLQIGGIAMAIIGLRITHEVVEYDEPVMPRRFRHQRAQWMVTPSASTTGGGLAVLGTF